MAFTALVVTCVLAVPLPSGGEICVKQDGEVSIPADATLSDSAKAFWVELAAKYPYICPFDPKPLQPLEKGETK